MSEFRRGARSALTITVIVVATFVPLAKVFAQASPLQQGADSLVNEFVTIATPFAILAVMVLGALALAGRISWGWIVSLVGICVIFGAPQIVDWSRGLFGV